MTKIRRGALAISACSLSSQVAPRSARSSYANVPRSRLTSLDGTMLRADQRGDADRRLGWLRKGTKNQENRKREPGYRDGPAHAKLKKREGPAGRGGSREAITPRQTRTVFTPTHTRIQECHVLSLDNCVYFLSLLLGFVVGRFFLCYASVLLIFFFMQGFESRHVRFHAWAVPARWGIKV